MRKNSPLIALYVWASLAFFPLAVCWGQTPIHGAGYCQAAPNDYCFVSSPLSIFWDGGMGGGVHVQRIEWDDSGKTTKITGIDPTFDGMNQWSITSEKLVDGVLFVTFKEQGRKKYKFKIVFGKIVSIEEVVTRPKK